MGLAFLAHAVDPVSVARQLHFVGHWGLLCAYSEGPAERGTTECDNEFPPRHGDNHWALARGYRVL